MASRKQEIRKEIKKKNAKLGIDVEAAKNIVDLQDQQGEDIHVEDFKNEEYTGDVIPFSTTPQKTKKGFVSKIKGVFDDERKQLKKLDKIAQEIISLEDKYSALSDEELANQTNVLKEKLNSGSELDDILVDAFAVAREAAWRQIHLKAFKVQLSSGVLTCHAEMLSRTPSQIIFQTSQFSKPYNFYKVYHVEVRTQVDEVR